MFTLFILDIAQVFPPAKKFDSIASFINLLIPTIMISAGVILLFMIIASGFSILQSPGNPEALKKSQKLLTYSIVGFGIIIVSYIIIRLLSVILNLKLPFS